MLAAVDATPPKPSLPATTAITRNTSAQYSIDFSVGVRPERSVFRPVFFTNSVECNSVPLPAFSEADAEPNTEIIDALILAGQAGIGGMVEHDRDLVGRIDAIAELESLTEQYVRAETFTVRL